MQDQLVSFETAKLAKEKGFKEATTPFDEIVVYNIDGEVCRYNRKGFESNLVDVDKTVPAPTQSLLQKWLREEKLMDVIVSPHGTYEYCVDIFTNMTGGILTFNEFSQVYEEILECGLQKALRWIV